jgi:hypothetical protein
MTDRPALRGALVPAFAWGSLWGIAEATLGYLLHAVPVPGLAGCIMGPLGLFFLWRAYSETRLPSAVLAAASVAATLKLVDFALPGRGAVMTLKPALAILLEGLAVAVLFAALPQTTRRKA